MIRFILKRRVLQQTNQCLTEGYITFDASIPELEAHLQSGGFDENGYDTTDLVGVEIIKEQAK